MKIEEILDNRLSLAESLSKDRLTEIGLQCKKDFERDLESRRPWEERTSKAMKLALQIAEKKSTPWENASNVKLPLLTVACTQFSSRTYPALVSGTDIVKMRTVGQDPDSNKSKRAKRVGDHMSYQVLEEDEEWEDQMDKLLMSIPIVGCGFKKSYFDPIKGYNVAEHVTAKDLVVDYFAKSLESAACVSHMGSYSRREIEDRIRRGIFLDIDLPDPQDNTKELDRTKDEVQGAKRPPIDDDTPYDSVEQHCYIDLDDDGYSEPYIVTFLVDSAQVVRILPRFREDDVSYNRQKKIVITPRHHFTKYSFMPSPDGGFYDLGFGVLLGPSNESINTLINQLIDRGTLNNLGGGFVGRGARLKGGVMRFKMGQFTKVPSSGDDLRKNIFMMPTTEPSAVLFQLLGYLVEYAERVSSVTDLMVGKTPGQNTPATTSMAALEEGMKVFTAIYKRMYRGMKHEFKIRYRLNQEYLDPESYFTVIDTGEDAKIYQQDYHGDPTDIRPTADPSIASSSQRIAKAEMLSQRSQSVGGYNSAAVERRILEAAGIEGIQEIFPTDEQGNPTIQPPPDPKIEIEKMKVQSEAQYKQSKLQGELMLMDAQVQEIETKCILNLAKAEAAEEGTQINAYKQELSELKERREIFKQLGEMQNARQANVQ